MGLPMDPVEGVDPVAAPVPAPPPVRFRRFDDTMAQRQEIYSGALNAIGSMPRAQNLTHRIEISDLGYDTEEFDPLPDDEKQALLKRGSLHRALKGTVRLIDQNTNEPLDEQRVTVAQIPHLTEQGLFIRNGVLWSLRNQLRLRPGVYARKKQSGDAEAHVNVKPGTGRGFRVLLEPKSGVFKVQVDQSTTKLYPLLRGLGVSDDAMKAAWGDELYNKNWRPVTAHDHNDIAKVVQKLGPKNQTVSDPALLPQQLKDILHRAEIDPDTSELTLGERADRLSPEQLLKISGKVLKVNRGEDPGDNRDSQAFQTIHGAEDLIQERLKRDPAGIMRRLLWKATRQGKLGNLNAGVLNDNLTGLFEKSGLGQTVEAINPFELYDARQAITRLGAGGISSPDVVSRDARGVQASYLGVIDSTRGPESSNLGLDLRATDSALKGSDGLLYTMVRNLKTGAVEPVSARELSKRSVIFPGEMQSDAKRVPGIRGDKIDYIRKDEADYELVSPNDMMSRATAMIPFPEAMKGQRLLMGSRMTQQALPLRDAEAPLVQTAGSDGKSLHAEMGAAMGARRSPVEGVVLDVQPGKITIATPDGKRKVVGLYNNMPMARKTALHNTPTVQKGQYVKPGDLLARSNFTDKDGTTAVGTNLRTAWMSAEGNTIEDAIVLSESAAKKLTSEQMYKADLDLGDIHSTKKDDYQAVYGDRFQPEQFEKLDDTGVVREGMEVRPGDPLILGMGKKGKRAIGALMETPKSSFSDRSQTWDHALPGVVTDVTRGRGGIRVTVKSYTPMTVGDKLTGRYGNKGIISEIRPDDQMPLDPDGQPVEQILNANGVISRVNPAVLAEALLGKVAQKTGKPYVIPGFGTKPGVVDFALEEALKHGVISKDEFGNLKDTVALTDPRDNRKIDNVFTGTTYAMKLHHLAESKLSARDQASYTTEGYPAKGGAQGSKRIGMLDLYSLLSSGSTEFLKDAKLVRGQRNDDYWRAIRNGETPELPQTSFADEQFRSQLQAAGVRLRQHGSRTALGPLLDKDVEELAPHAIEKAETLDYDTMEPIPGGLFDIRTTGGGDGNKFARIDLPVKVPHPLFMDPIQRVLGLTEKKLRGVLAGTEELHGQKGPDAVLNALKGVDIDAGISAAKEQIRTGSMSKRDAAVKRLNYLTGLKKTGTAPADLMVSKIPVIPPKYRPISVSKGTEMVHDLNYLYKDVLEAKQNYQDAMQEFGSAPEEYDTLVNAVQAVSGVNDPVNPRSQEQGVKGILRYAIGVGDSPKYAQYHRRVLGTAVDTVGRGTITAAKDLDMDEVRIPQDMAWTMFRPFVIRRLVRSGLDATDAVTAVKDRAPEAKAALEQEMRDRPVVYNRAPSLHRYSYVGAWGKLGDDDSIGLPYHVLKGIGGDYDGDSALTSTWIRLSGQVTEAVYKTLRTHTGDLLAMPAAQLRILRNGGVINLADFPVLPESKRETESGITLYEVPKGVEVYAMDPATGSHRWCAVESFSVHARTDVVRVTVEGRGDPVEMWVTRDHSLIGYDDEGVIRPMTPAEINGRMVPAVRKLAEPVAGLEQDVTATDYITYEGPASMEGQLRERNRSHTIPLDREVGFFLGALIGDGWVDAGDRICIAANDESTREAFIAAAASSSLPCALTTETLVTQYEAASLGGKVLPRTRCSLGPAWFARWLRPHIGTGAENKKVPSFSLNAGLQHLLGLLDGLLCTDGVVSHVVLGSGKVNCLIGYDTCSVQLVDGVQYVLRRLGIQSSVSRYSAPTTGTPMYKVLLSSLSMKQLVARTGFTLSHSDKQVALKKICAHVQEDSSVVASTDLVPYPRHLHRALTAATRAGFTEFSNATSEASAVSSPMAGRANGYWSRSIALKTVTWALKRTAEAFAALCQNRGNKKLSVDPGAVRPALEAYARLLADTDMGWRRVTGVEDAGVMTTYDLTVPGPYTFTTSAGIVIQDSINVHVPSGAEAVDEVKQKLMPSKNLFHAANFETHLEPMQDYLAGLYLATRPDPRAKTVTFATAAEAKRAYARGEIKLSTPIRILN